MKTIMLEQSEKEILRSFRVLENELQIPEYLDKAEVLEVLEDAKILWQSDNEHNFCVLAAWVDEERPFETMFYFSRFFNIGNKTVVSHDATANNFTQMLIRLSEILNSNIQ